MNWKKTCICILVMLMVFSFAACKAENTEALLQTDHKAVGLCVRDKADEPEYYSALVEGLKKLHCGVLLVDSKSNQATQNEKVRHMISQGCDVLVVEPVMVSGLDEVIRMAREAQLPLIVLDRQPAGEVLDSYERLYYVGPQSAQAGTAQAHLLDVINVRGDLNGDGTVSYMILRGPEDHIDAQLITDSCKQSLEQMDTQFLCTVTAQWGQEEGRVECAKALARFGKDIEVIFCNDTQLAAGAVEAVKDGGWAPGQDMNILAVGTSDQLEKLIDQGAVTATVRAEIQPRVTALAKQVGLLLENKPLEKTLYVDYTAASEED